MQDTEYNLQDSHNHDDRYFTESEINAKIKYGAKTIYEGQSNSVYVEYVVVGNYKVVTLFYYRNGGEISVPTGTTTLATTELPDAWKPTHQIQTPYARAVVVLQTNGNISIYNGTGSALNNYQPSAMFTYIVRNNTI